MLKILSIFAKLTKKIEYFIPNQKYDSEISSKTRRKTGYWGR